MSQDTMPLSPQDCLIALMMSVSMSDSNVRTSELVSIQQVVNYLPVFADYDVLGQPELRLLEEIRYELDIDRLHAAAIERGARARHMTL